MALNVSSADARSACCSTAGSTFASVVRKPSMVAMFGSIIPEPLAVPPTVKVPRGVFTVTACSLGNGSVVMIARAITPPCPRSRAAAAWRMPGTTLSILSPTPITPGRRHQHLFDRAAQRRRHLHRHLAGVEQAVLAGAGVGAAAVDHHGAGAAEADVEMPLRHRDRRGLGEVGGEQAGGRRRLVRREHAQVERAGLGLDAAVQSRRGEPFGRGHAAGRRRVTENVDATDVLTPAPPPAPPRTPRRESPRRDRDPPCRC